MKSTQQNIAPLDFENAQGREGKSDRMEKILRGVIKKELIKRLENQSSLFPISNKSSIHYIDFYIIKKCYFAASKATKEAIVFSAKAIHRREIRRIQKAIRTIEENIETILPHQIASPLLEKITRYVIYHWVKKEFYISKEEIRRFVYGFCIFYPELRPKNDSK